MLPAANQSLHKQWTIPFKQPKTQRTRYGLFLYSLTSTMNVDIVLKFTGIQTTRFSAPPAFFTSKKRNEMLMMSHEMSCSLICSISYLASWWIGIKVTVAVVNLGSTVSQLYSEVRLESLLRHLSVSGRDLVGFAVVWLLNERISDVSQCISCLFTSAGKKDL